MKKTSYVLISCLILSLVLTGCASKFDASAYANGVLDVLFQDDPAGALSTMEDVTAEELKDSHLQSMQQFVADNITYDLSMNELKEQEFIELCEKIFAAMKYSVGEAEKTGRDEYEVPVEIWPSDIFVRFHESLKKDSEKVAEAVKNGEYQGTDEEIAQQVLNDIVNHSYELLDVAYYDMEFGESQTVTLRVEKGDNNEYSVNEEDIDNLITKILRLDEIQD